MALPDGPAATRSRGGAASSRNHVKDITMLGTILIVILILMLLGVLPTWGHSRSWGYGPSGALGIILLILIVLVLTGHM